MSGVAELPPQAPVVIASSVEAMGDEGRFLTEFVTKQMLHQSNTFGFLNAAEEEADDDYEYQPVPLKIAGEVRVKYHFVGKLQPMKYDLDE